MAQWIEHVGPVRVVKELVLKVNGLCPREFKSRRCRFLSCKRVRVAGVMVSIATFQAVDPGSIHGPRIFRERKNKMG